MSFRLTDKFLEFALLGAEWVLWLLVILSVISVYVMIERFLFFRSVWDQDTVLRKPLLHALTDGDIEEARRLTRDRKGSGARIIGDMLGRRDRGRGAVEATMAASRSEEKIRLERHLSYLGTLGANAPFIGLFGTVLGIIQAFNDLAATGVNPGGEQSAAVMSGISEALVATAIGLLVAIPAVVVYNLGQRRVKRGLAQADAMTSAALPFIVPETTRGEED